MTQEKQDRNGAYYTVHIEAAAGIRIPCVVFAASGDAAAAQVRVETGCLVQATDITGPYSRL